MAEGMSDLMKTIIKRNEVFSDQDDENCKKCEQLLDNCRLKDGIVESSSCCNVDVPADVVDKYCDSEVRGSDNICLCDKIGTENDDNIEWTDIPTANNDHYKNIQIYKSQNVHIGNNIHIHGPVLINKFAPKITKNTFINNPQLKTFPIVSRRTWLAQPPLDPEDRTFLTGPAKLVIICHSASEESSSPTENNLLVRLIQQFHIESRHFNDIAYNFLAGGDGNIYEGRGWDIVGSHTMGYNRHSIGICFVGCYIKTLPPISTMKAVKDLIKYGVEIGKIAVDYSLVGHCQCRGFESPGRRLFEELKTWDRWDGSVDVHNPAKCLTL